MKDYKRIEFKITEFEAEDVITTSGIVPQPVQRSSTQVRNGSSVVYGGTDGTNGDNWLPWLF